MKQHKALTLAVSVFLATFLSACHLAPLASRPLPVTPQSGVEPQSPQVAGSLGKLEPAPVEWLRPYGIQAVLDPSLQVTTVAGDGTFGYLDGVATASVLGGVAAMVADSKGNVFFCDQGSMIRKLAPDGKVTTFAGSLTRGYANGSGQAAAFNYPRGITIDAQDTLYVADSENNRIRSITPDGVVRTVAGTGEAVSRDTLANPSLPEASFNRPMAICMSRTGTLLVGEANTAVREVRGANVTTRLPSFSSNAYCLFLQEDSSGTIFETCLMGVSFVLRLIERLPDGSLQGVSAGQAAGLAQDASGSMYVANFNGNILKYQDGGMTLVAGPASPQEGYADGPAETALFARPWALAISRDGAIYVADSANNRIRKISRDNTLRLEVAPPFFSPNGDGVLDMATLSVKAGVPWKLSVVDQGVIATGRVDTTLAWDGRIGGRLLPDGAYRLALEEDSSAPSVQPCNPMIVIDTVTPTVSEFDVVQDDPASAPDSYRLVAKISDSGSGVERKSLKLTFSGNLRTTQKSVDFDPSSGLLSYLFDATETAYYASGPGGTLFAASARMRGGGYRPMATEPGFSRSALSGSDCAGNVFLFEKQLDIFNRAFISSLQIIKDGKEINRVRPLLDGEADYSAYGDAIVCLKATVMRKSNKSVAGLPVQFDSVRVPNTGGHVNVGGDNHGENGPTGQFRLNDAFSRTVDPTSVDVKTATIQALTDANGVATVWYRPYGFAGEEKLTATIRSSTHTANLTIGLTNLVAMTQNDVLAIGDISSHPSGYYGTDITVKRMTKAARLLSERVGAGFRVNGVSLPFGGPFDVYHTWKINGGAHALHRSGFNSDFSLRLTDGVGRAWDDNDVWYAIAKSGGGDPLDEANELGRKKKPRGRNDHWHVNWLQFIAKGEVL